MTQINKGYIATHEERPHLDTHINTYGIKIYKCCMSCANKSINSLGNRKCLHKNAFVGKYDTCESWALADGLERAGIGGGKVDIHCREKFIQRRLKELERLGFIKDEKCKQETSDYQ